MEEILPKVSLERNFLSDTNEAVRREWIVTNGLGGYASSTALGINTRKYHGLLVASFNPPTDRRVLLTQLNEEVEVDNKSYRLYGERDHKNCVKPPTNPFLDRFILEPFPTYEYVIDEVHVRKTVFMPNEKSATIVVYNVSNNSLGKVFIRALPLVNSRHFHSVTNKDDINWRFLQKPSASSVTIQPSIPLSTLIISSSNGSYIASQGKWIEKYFRVEASRGESCQDEDFQPGFFLFEVAPKETRGFSIGSIAGRSETEAQAMLSSLRLDPKGIHELREEELKRRQDLLQKFAKQKTDISMEEWLKWLVLSTDSFIVNRESTKMKSVIAGYHWFEDWGRDSLISLPGLTLVTGRFEDAEEILLTFGNYCHKGIVPNRFPDYAGDKPEYNTVDATLWYFNAVLQFLKYTGNFDFVRQRLWSTLKSIIDHHVEGTLYNIQVDEDGLVLHGPQLTWMDVAIDAHPITPREGKAVEIQALWFNALKTMQLLATYFKQEAEAEEYLERAEEAKKSFLEKFWNHNESSLFDVIQNGYKDPSMRPNQVIAAALDFTMLEDAKAQQMIDTVEERFWSSYGLRTLASSDSRYVGRYMGDRIQRDAAYHNGTVWAWLTGPFVTAFLKTKKYTQNWRSFAFENFLKSLTQEEPLRAGLGTVSEIFDGDPPYQARGCIAQAWSVAEPLRAYVEDVMLKRPPYEHQIFEMVGPRQKCQRR
ncbi:MAG: amylo-alpha-1,6-glucosidase [Candidatus Bathyarchaeota archaeon]|jgi:predicted glycogen debranching enzyme